MTGDALSREALADSDPEDAPVYTAPVEGLAPRQRAATAAVVLLGLAGILVVLLDWREVRDVLVRADWQWIPLAFTFTGISYLCLSYSFMSINRSFGIRLEQRDLLRIGFISSAMIAAVGGLAGHSIRVLMMTRRGLAAGDVMAPSLFHAYLESLVFFALIPAGLGYLLLTHPLSSGVAVWLSIGTVVLGVAFAITAVVFFFGSVRSGVLWVVRSIWRCLTRRDIGASLVNFESTLRKGLSAVRDRPWVLAPPVALILVDRLARVAVVWICFQALDSQAGLAVMVTGFAIGMAVGVMSMVPGGLGVQEGSMAGAYRLLGVPLEEAVLASVLFRAVYYIVPFGISLGFYRRAMRTERLSQEGTR